MKIELNLESKESKAVFLALLNHPAEVQELLVRTLNEDRGTKSPFEKVLLELSERELFEVHYNLFNSAWEEVRSKFTEGEDE